MRMLRLAKAIWTNRRGGVPRPGWCTFLTTYRCNARCGMCDSWKLPAGKELSVAEVEAVFRKIGRLDVVRLSGGEPFLRTDLLEVAEAVWATTRPLVVHLTTNGSFPDRVLRFAESFSKPKALRFMVSLDGLEATHDASRGRAAPFAKALETITRLAEARPRLGLEVSVNHTVISNASMAESRALTERLAPLGVEVQSVLAYRESSMYGADRHGRVANDLTMKSGYPLHPDIEPTAALEFTAAEQARAKALKAPLRWGKQYYLTGLADRLANRPDPRPAPRCAALRNHLRLLPDGSVPVCQFNTSRVGNLLEQSLAEVMGGEEATRGRAWVDRCAGCWAECEVIPSALYSGDLLTWPLRRHFA